MIIQGDYHETIIMFILNAADDSIMLCLDADQSIIKNPPANPVDF